MSYYTCCEDGMLSQVPPTDSSGKCPACLAAGVPPEQPWKPLTTPGNVIPPYPKADAAPGNQMCAESHGRCDDIPWDNRCPECPTKVCLKRAPEALLSSSPVAPVGVPTLSDEQITGLAHRMAWRYSKSGDLHHSDSYTFNARCLLNFARALLSAQGCELATDATKQHPHT